MTLDELRKKLEELDNMMDEAVTSVQTAATYTQEIIYKTLLEQVDLLKLDNGNLDPTQDLAKRFAIIQKKMEGIIQSNFTKDLKPYFSSYNDVESQVVSLHKSYNEIEVDVKKLTPQKQAIYTQANYYLTEGLADNYIQPAKFLMMQQVTAGVDINQMRTALKQWDEGTLPAGKTASDSHAPRLQAYSTQIARDTLYSYQGAIQDVIKDEYGLTKFIYSGGLLKDSRPLCRHLINLRRKIDLSEMPALIKKFPQGLRPNTTAKNWVVQRPYNCIHTCMMVR